jgi:hypothetical protein
VQGIACTSDVTGLYACTTLSCPLGAMTSATANGCRGFSGCHVQVQSLNDLNVEVSSIATGLAYPQRSNSAVL